MQLRCFKTLWGHEGTPDQAIQQAHQGGFDGIEGPSPSTNRGEWKAKLQDANLAFIAEVCTAGSYVPRREVTIKEHLDSFQQGVEHAAECSALFVNSMAGCDAWSITQSVQFFGQADQIAQHHGIVASFETHRGRSFFNPWATRDILCQLPELKITCDFSHWCVVSERLIDGEDEELELCAQRAHHIHTRVGYDQGPQVSDPALPQYRNELEAHERWWQLIWKSQRERGYEISTQTPEFGPDGYGPEGADLNTINRWMMQREREQFELWSA